MMSTDLDLTTHERIVLDTIRPEWTRLPDLTEHTREAVDYLVLSGLVERHCAGEPDAFGPGGWLDEWRLTEAALSIINLLDLRERGHLLDRPG